MGDDGWQLVPRGHSRPGQAVAALIKITDVFLAWGHALS